MPRDGGDRSKQRQAEPPDGAEAAFAGLERGGTAAPVSPPHPEGARKLRGVKRLEAWARLACLRRRTSTPPLCVRVLVGARSHFQAGPVGLPADPVGSAQLFRAGRQARLFIQAELFCCGGYALPRALVDVENVEPRLQISV